MPGNLAVQCSSDGKLYAYLGTQVGMYIYNYVYVTRKAEGNVEQYICVIRVTNIAPMQAELDTMRKQPR